ncbi:hypothetical protein BJX96DRAFT_161231 [Aspergillus floccosus]
MGGTADILNDGRNTTHTSFSGGIDHNRNRQVFPSSPVAPSANLADLVSKEDGTSGPEEMVL